LNQEKVGKNQKVEKIVMKKKEAKNGAHWSWDSSFN
jgi:hypothetical protein